MVLRFLLKIFSPLLFIVLLSGIQKPAMAQSFGFGCLGLVGGFGGYSYQNYKPAGLNDFIVSYNTIRTDSLSSPMSSFGKSVGFRVGLNLYRANLEGLILTAKGFYQDLNEKQSSVVQSDYGTTNSEFDVKMTSWAIGFDLGTSVAGSLSWKVIDAALLFSHVDFTTTDNFPGAVTKVENYSSSTDIGYSVGTGFILGLIDRYVSLEGLVAFTVMNIDQVKKDDGTPLNSTEQSGVTMNNFIKSGGFNAVIQLNIGFPL